MPRIETVSKSQADKRDQYHHYIPQFILRSFQADSSHRIRTGEPKGQHEAQRNAQTDPTVLWYNVNLGILQNRPVRDVYGRRNLYRDVSAPNVNHVEQKLAILEADFSSIWHNLHRAIHSPSKVFAIPRPQLGTLHKFLFLMHYRAGHRSTTHWKEEINTPLKDWIQKRRQDKGLKDEKELWIDALQYYLDTPHHIIAEEGEEIVRRIGGRDKVARMSCSRVDPDINWYALEYEVIANLYFMGIWEAADDSEFVLGSNAFGVIKDGHSTHLIFVLGPRLVVAYRSKQAANVSLNAGFPEENGGLVHIPMKPPTVHNKFEIDSIPVPTDTLREMTKSGWFDEYRFRVTKLTKTQTQAVNISVLYNIIDEGAVTFVSRAYMLETLEAYFKHDQRFASRSIRYNALFKKLYETANSNGSVSEQAFNDIINAIAKRTMKFSSDYARAYHVYHAATDDPDLKNHTALKIHKLTSMTVVRYPLSLPRPPDAFRPYPVAQLLDDIPPEEAVRVMQFVRQALLECGIRQEVGPVNELIFDACGFGLLEWLAKNRHDVLQIHDFEVLK